MLPRSWRKYHQLPAWPAARLYPLNMTNCPCCSASYDTGKNSLPGCSASLGSGSPALRQMRGNKQAPGLAHTNTHIHTFYVHILTNNWLLLSVKVHHSFCPFEVQRGTIPVIFLVMGKCPPGIPAASAKSTLLGISCSNTVFIDLYQASACSLSVGERGTTYLDTKSSQRANIVSYCRQPGKTNR